LPVILFDKAYQRISEKVFAVMDRKQNRN